MNRTIAFFLSILLCSIDVGFASAEETGLATGGGKVRVLRQDMQKRTSGGVIDGCEITFTVAFEDFIYKKGGISFAQGGIALWGASKGQPLISLKVTTLDLIGNQTELTPLPYASVIVGSALIKPVPQGIFACDDGGFCSANEFYSNAVSLLGIVSEPRLELSLQRREGGADVKVPFEIKADVASSFGACADEFIVSVETKLK